MAMLARCGPCCAAVALSHEGRSVVHLCPTKQLLLAPLSLLDRLHVVRGSSNILFVFESHCERLLTRDRRSHLRQVLRLVGESVAKNIDDELALLGDHGV